MYSSERAFQTLDRLSSPEKPHSSYYFTRPTNTDAYSCSAWSLIFGCMRFRTVRQSERRHAIHGQIPTNIDRYMHIAEPHTLEPLKQRWGYAVVGSISSCLYSSKVSLSAHCPLHVPNRHYHSPAPPTSRDKASSPKIFPTHFHSPYPNPLHIPPTP